MPRKRKKRLSKGLRKYIRQEKARIRREFFFNLEEQKKQIDELYKKASQASKASNGRFTP